MTDRQKQISYLCNGGCAQLRREALSEDEIDALDTLEWAAEEALEQMQNADHKDRAALRQARKDFNELWNEEEMSRDKYNNLIDRSLAWDEFVSDLHKSGKITLGQYQSWGGPD